MTPHASHLINEVGTEAPKSEICNIPLVVLLKIQIFYDVMPYRCVCTAHHVEGP